jgi:hypothetical protein
MTQSDSAPQPGRRGWVEPVTTKGMSLYRSAALDVTLFFQMSSNSSPTAIPSYRKVLLDQIEKSRVILSFDPLDFELKPFFWYVCQYGLSHLRLTPGQACGWQQTRDTGQVAGVWHSTQIPRAALFVSTPAHDRRRTPIYRSENPAEGLRGSHWAIRRRMPERTLRISWSVARRVP